MSLDYAYVVCADCGKGFDYDELAQNHPDSWRSIDLWALKHGRELQPYLQKLWVPKCPECGGDKFYPMINSDEIVDSLQEMLGDGSLIDEVERSQVQALLALWQHRMQDEDAEWRRNVGSKQPTKDDDCDCGRHH